jgi:hypothetical protein
MSRKLIVIIIIVLAIILVGVGYFVYKKPAIQNPAQGPVNEPITPVQKPVSSAAAALSNFKLYKNSEFGFQIQYPATWAVSEENIENVRGEQTKAFYFKKPNSDLRFTILPRDGLSYGLPDSGTTTDVMISGSIGSQTQYTLADGRRLWLLHPNYGLFNWLQDIGRIDILSSVEDPMGDTRIFEIMLNSFKLSK